jgi:YVTN family beta-propeller protein
MKAFARVLGDLAMYALLALLPVLMVTAGCKSSSDDPSATSHRAYVSNYLSESISVINTETNAVVKTIRLPHRAGYTAVLPALNRLYVTGLDTNDITVINTVSNQIIRTIHLPGRAGAVAADPVTNKVFIVEHGSLAGNPPLYPLGTHVWILNGYTLATPTSLTVPSAVNLQFLAVDSTNRRVYVSDAGDGVTSGVVFPINISASAETILSSIACGISPSGVAVLPQGHLVYVANADDDTVTVIDNTAEDSPVTNSIAVGGSPVSVAIDPSLARAVVTNALDNSVSLVNTAISAVIVPPSPVIMGTYPDWAAVDSASHKAYVANAGSNDLSVMDLQDSPGRVLVTIPVGSLPLSVSVIE